MEINRITRELLAAGYAKQDTPPGMRPYNWFYGGWTYTPETLHKMVFETPCGLLIKGNHFGNGDMSYMGVEWMPENDNPVVCCPRFGQGPCELNHEFLRDLSMSDGAVQCACHKTEREYDYEHSYDKAHDDVWREAERLFQVYSDRRNGRVCRNQCQYNRSTKKWTMRYDPKRCLYNCSYCPVLDREISPKKGNVYYDVKISRTIPGEGLFPSRQVASITKGVKLLDKTTSITICEVMAKISKREIQRREEMRLHCEMFFDPSLTVEVRNVRAERRETRDLLQDLKDAAEGIAVIHDIDEKKAAAQRKRDRRTKSKQARVTRLERLLLERGYDGLEDIDQIRVRKLLDDERILELEEQQCRPADLEPTQLTFDDLE